MKQSKLHVAIVGLGLIGGSLGLALAQRGVRVSAWNHHDTAYSSAQAAGINCVPTLAELAQQNPDIVVLCNPLAAMPDVLQQLKPHLFEHTLLTDVGSVKGLVAQQVADAGLRQHYVGAHPMTGNEHSGWQAADAHLFDNSLWAITVEEDTQWHKVALLLHLIITVLHNRAIVVGTELHDRAAALISHMPHVVSTALSNELVDAPYRDVAVALAAGSWRDMTRVSLTDPQRTQAMVYENPRNVAQLLHSIANRLEETAAALESNDTQGLTDFFQYANPYRDYKGEDLTSAIRSRLHFNPEHDNWQELLEASARRGEQITAVCNARETSATGGSAQCVLEVAEYSHIS